jgi:hypothetical protein
MKSSEDFLKNKKKGLFSFNFLKIAWWRWAISAGLLLLSFLLQKLASGNPEVIEQYYSRGLYLYIGHGLTFANRIFSFSIAEALGILLLLLIAGLLVRHARRLWQGGVSFGGFLLSSLSNLLVLTGVFVVLFLTLWGLNYSRQPLAESLRWERRESSAEELESICRMMIWETNRNYEESQAKVEQGRPKTSWPELYKVIESAYQREILLGNSAQGNFGPPKPVYFSRMMSWLGISGIYVPFTGEPNFNAEQPACELPYTIAHEKAHQRGFALEDEANFIAFLICTKSSDPYSRYSGYLMGSWHVLKALYRASPERYQKVVATLGPGPLADLKEMREFWRRYETRLSEVSEKVNNTYLKVNRVKSGVENYGEVITLIMGYYSNNSGWDAANAPVDFP